MTTVITGLDDDLVELEGSPFQGWNHTWSGYIFVADEYARIQPVAGNDITGRNVQMYSGWPATTQTDNSSADTSIARTSAGDTITLDNFSWTISALTGDDSILDATDGNWRNHALNRVNIDWNDGDILVRGFGPGQRFGLGSPAAPNAFLTTGRFSNMRIQAHNARVIFQLRAFQIGSVSNPSFDDFTYPGARTDVNFPGGQVFTGIASGAANAVDAVGGLDTANGNFSGIGNAGALPPTTLITPNIRRLRAGESTTPTDVFRHSPKATPLIIVDPIFTFIQESDVSTQTEVLVTSNNAINQFYKVFSSSDQGNNGIQPGVFVWFGKRYSFQPQTAAGDMLSGTYWILTDSSGGYSPTEYQINGITNNNDYGLTEVGAPPATQQSDTVGFTFDGGVPANTDQVFSLTDSYTNPTSGGIVSQNDDLTIRNTGNKAIVFHAFGYTARVLRNFNPRTAGSVETPTMFPANWLKPIPATPPTVYTLNDAAIPIYDFLQSDPQNSHDPRKSITDTTVTLGASIVSGMIRQNDVPPSYTVSGTDVIWEMGASHIPETATVSRAGTVLTSLTTIDAVNLTFDAGGAEITVPNLIVSRIEGLINDINVNSKEGGLLSGIILDTFSNIRLTEVDVSGVTLPLNGNLNIFGTNPDGSPYQDTDFATVGATNTVRGLPEVETITLPAHKTLQGWYATTRIPTGGGSEVALEIIPIRLESDESVDFILSTAGGPTSYRGIAWSTGDILTVYYKYDSRIQTAALPLDNITYQETVAKHTFGDGSILLPEPTMIPTTQTELAVQPSNFATNTYRFADYNAEYAGDPLTDEPNVLTIGTPDGGYSGNNALNKDAEVSLALALLIGNDQDYMRKIVELSIADSENDLVSFFTVLGGYSIRWNPAAITLATDQVTTDTNQYRIQQQVANWEYDEVTFPDTMDFSLARTGAPEVISFEPGEASLQQVQSAAQTGIDASRTGGLVADVQNINRWMVAGDGGRFLGIKPRINEFNEESDYDI